MDPILLYSTNTLIAYRISELYYKHEHYVWCTPHFSAKSSSAHGIIMPPSSTPLDIYRALQDDVTRGDRHSSKIAENKVGILNGATYKHVDGVIQDVEKGEIGAIISAAEIADFRPLIYVIPFDLVKSMIVRVPVDKRANPLSEEYVIPSLPRSCFDILEFER